MADGKGRLNSEPETLSERGLYGHALSVDAVGCTHARHTQLAARLDGGEATTCPCGHACR